jgi:hypothetical protein
VPLIVAECLRDEVILVEEAAEAVASADAALMILRRDSNRLGDGRLLLERAVRPMRVVVSDVLVQHPLEMPARDDQEPVETFTPDAASPTLRVRLRPRRRDRRTDHLDPFRAEHLVEGGG